MNRNPAAFHDDGFREPGEGPDLKGTAMAYRTLLGILVTLGLSIGAQAIDLRGKVSDASGKPVPGAIVELATAKLKDTTGSEGAYALGSGPISIKALPAPAAVSPRLVGGVLELALPRNAPVRVEILDLKGNLLEKAATERAPSGTYRLNLDGRMPADRLLIIKASIGSETTVFRCLPSVAGWVPGMRPQSSEGPAPGGLVAVSTGGPSEGLAKAAASVDTLTASAVGYQTRRIPIAAYDQILDITLESAGCVVPQPPSSRDAVTIDMAATGGAPAYLASGMIYGIAEDGVQPPDSLLRGIKAKGFRAGRGVSEGCGQQAWNNHWKVIKAYYSRAKALGATLLLLVSDDYGYFCTFPGDGGDWTGLETFMGQLIDSVKANGMTGPDVRWELWNEPDLDIFWPRTQAQWLETWKHAYRQVRAALPDAAIEGPSLASGPGGSWANAFYDYVKANDVVPDYFAWHEERGNDDPVADLAVADKALSGRGITGYQGFDVNEYGTIQEQNPGHSAWYLARFERTGMQGMRGNWADGTEFFSNMAGLAAPGWRPNGQYWIYKRYADQSGVRSGVVAGSQVDAVAYQDAAAGKSIIVVGNRGGVTGAVNVLVRNMPAWLQAQGAVKVTVERMPAGNGALAAPLAISSSRVPVACGSLAVALDWSNPADGYVVTLGRD